MREESAIDQGLVSQFVHEKGIVRLCEQTHCLSCRREGLRRYGRPIAEEARLKAGPGNSRSGWRESRGFSNQLLNF
mgnify:CR=1 FL=1